MVEIKPGLLPSMALGFEAQRAQLVTPLTPATLFGAAQMGETWHVLLDGKVVAFGGHFPAWAGRNVVWGYLSKDAGPAIRAMTRYIRAELEAASVQRFEAYVARNFKSGHRWIRLLGFKSEGTLRKIAHGTDYTMYARVK